MRLCTVATNTGMTGFTKCIQDTLPETSKCFIEVLGNIIILQAHLRVIIAV